MLGTITALIFLFPAFWLFSSAFKGGSELFRYPLHLFPTLPTFENFVKVWENMRFMTFFANTLYVAVTATVLTVVFSTMCGYALAKYRYRWLNMIFITLLATTLLPTEIMMAPSFMVILRLGLYNKLLGLIIPTLSTLTGVFMLRQYFVTVPDSFIEAARIDGANEYVIFLRLMVPFAMPINAILAIFSFRWRWNDYVWPLIVIDDPRKYTLQLALRNLVGEMAIDWSSLLAASVLSMIPIIVIFLSFQRFIMSVGMGSGVKG
jgi:alpha-1,4-digalacturonate transport system permease protein